MARVWQLLLTLSLLIGSYSSALAATQPTPRIVGGSVVGDDRYPFMASVVYDLDGDEFFSHGCGGSVVGSRWVLTAAHCVVDAQTGAVLPTAEVAVILGALDLSDQTQGRFINAQNIYVHPGFDLSTFVADIALIELATDSNLPLLSLPVAASDVPVIDEPAIVAGWGLLVEGGFGTSPLLREAVIPIVSHSQCLPFYQSSLQLDANVCAGGDRDGGVDSCQGDSGGPLFVSRDGLLVQAGIVSYGEGCARPGIPGVYTRVSTYTDWVASFVPDLQTTMGSSGTADNDDSINESDVVVLSDDSPTGSGSLLRGEVDVYEVTGAIRVDLLSLTGDADLFIFSGTRFDVSDIQCVSDLISPEDSCDLVPTSGQIFAAVFSYSDSTYEITAVGETSMVESGSPIQTDPSAQDGPDVDGPGVDGPNEGSEEDGPEVDGSGVVGSEEDGSEVDGPDVVEDAFGDSDVSEQEQQASNDDLLPDSTSSNSGGGMLGALSLFILALTGLLRRT